MQAKAQPCASRQACSVPCAPRRSLTTLRAHGSAARERHQVPTSHDSARRQVLLSLLSAAVALGATQRAGAEVYEEGLVSLTIPEGWIQSTAQISSGGRRTVVWFPKDADPNDLSVSLVTTGLSADFTGLGSFGSATDFGQGLVNQMDQAYLARARGTLSRPAPKIDQVQVCKLIDAKQTRGMYTVEYSIKKPQEELKVVTEAIAAGNDGVYNRLFTLTAQRRESASTAAQEELAGIVSSFKLKSK
ncbi:unnamed protein product [Pedinophyceae sp. YPF-701]|nr:unnamed protein product [Pedinophyceae sp. YPF-701]